MSAIVTAGRELRDSELRALVEHAPDGIFVADLEGRYTYVNEAGCRLLGYSPAERGQIIGRTIVDLVAPDEVSRLARVKLELLRGKSHVGEWTLQRKDGSRVPVEVNANILADGRWQGFVRDISERRRNEQRLELALDGSKAALWDTDLRTGEVVLSAAWSEMLGGPREETRTTLGELVQRIHPDDAKGAMAASLETLKGLRSHYFWEHRVRMRDGGWIWILSRGKVTERDARGRALRMVGTIIDISERKAHEAERDAALQQAEADRRWLQAVLDILPVGVWIADASGRIVSNNPAGERIWCGARYVPVSEFGQYRGWWVDTGKPIAAEEWALARALRKGETSTGELVRIQCFDGSLKTIINSAAPLRDENGAVKGAIVVNEDITALHEAQEKQRASEQLLRTVIDLLPVGLYIADREGRITRTNPAGERIWQGVRHVTPERYGEYRGWWVDTGKPVTPEEWALARALKKGETSSGELIRIQCFDGSYKTVINFAAPIRSDAGEIVGAVAVNEDITSLQKTQEQLRAAVRDREQILAVVTHDLRNPLSGLMMGASAVEHAARALSGGEPVRDLAAQLMDITRQMSGMVDDLLAVAVTRSGGESMVRLAPVPASALVARAAEAARPLLARESIELKIEVLGELPTVHADADRVLRVFANLLDNALKFTSPPGRITLGAERSMGGVRFSVANSGAALPKKHLEAMFRPFWQAGHDRRGAGLGLAICRSIVEAHGGSIWAEPAEGQRVRVCFVLPRQPAATDLGVSSS